MGIDRMEWSVNHFVTKRYMTEFCDGSGYVIGFLLAH